MGWFCWHEGTCADPKFGIVARVAKVDRVAVIAIWARLCETASEADDRGRIDSAEHDEIAELLDLDPEVVARVMVAMADRGVIKGGALANWAKRNRVKFARREADRRYKAKKRREMSRGDIAGISPDIARSQEDSTVEDTPPPDPPPQSLPAQVAAGFCEIRERLWPRESRLPAPMVTLETQAGDYLALMSYRGVMEIIERVAKQNAERGLSAPTNLGFCRHSIENAAAQARPKATRPAGDINETRLATYRQTGMWQPEWGDEPSWLPEWGKRPAGRLN